MKHTAQDILNYVEDNDVKFVRLAFCDIFGNQKNISVFAGDLPYAFEQGVCFDGSSIAGFMNTEESDLVLWPDPDTMTILPWRPTEGRVMRMYCDITLPNGRPFAGNSRGYLQSVVKRAKAMGLRCDVGCECEFYLFQTDEHGNPTRIPMDHGATLTSPLWTRPRTSAARSALPWRIWACAPSTATTKAALARTKWTLCIPPRSNRPIT